MKRLSYYSRTTIARILALLACATAASAQERCVGFPEHKDALKFLKALTLSTPLACKELALKRLADFTDPQGAPLLIRFIDVGHELTPEERNQIDRLKGIGDSYPAVIPLMRMGKVVGPLLADVLTDDSRTRLAKDNAVGVLLYIFGYEKHRFVRHLVIAARKQRDAREGDRLLEEARRVALGCGSDLCKAELTR